MPIIIHEIVITTNIDKSGAGANAGAPENCQLSVEEVVKQTVEKVMEILEEKKQR
ncbi:MAG: hypothetical protein KF862_25660 [Chitinophagaceae bacterium]|nr:hypothetical protein [Chitinophagaceae bacterium]